MSDAFSVVGKRVPQKDGVDLVTGVGKFIDDIVLPKMLYGKILRSAHAHARILNIDTSKAEKLPGVKAVITAKDTPRLRYGVAQIYDEIRDEPVLTDDKVRFYGDRVAAVAAVDVDTVEEALDLIEVDYEVLPAVFDPEEAMKPGAPKVHERFYKGDGVHGFKECEVENNICITKRVLAGDVEKGFKESDVILEGRYTAHGQEHSHLETHGAVAAVDLMGNIKLWTTTQTPFTIRRDLVKMLGIPLGKIDVIGTKCGGAFGGKNEVTVEPHAILLAQKTGRPVKMIYSREEEFIASTIRHPFIFYSKIGVRKDGKLMAKQGKAILNTGAYSNHGVGVAYLTGAIFATLYRVENVNYEGFVVYTNCTYGGAFRGYGNPQMTFAIETEMDRVAETLNMNPVELRLINAPVAGEKSACGILVGSCGLKDCIAQAAKTVGWENKWKGWETR